MDSLNSQVREYATQLGKGHIQKAYRGIMTFMSELKGHLESRHPDYQTSAIYPGYMDMTYFAFTPSVLKDMKLKVAIVFLHEECTFELWLAGNNRQVQADCLRLLRDKDIGRYSLSSIHPGVDSIIAWPATEHPDFDNPDELKKRIEQETIRFAHDMINILA